MIPVLDMPDWRDLGKPRASGDDPPQFVYDLQAIT